MFVIWDEKVLRALFNALLISDIRVDLVKNGQFRTVGGGNVKTGLSHQGKKPDRF